MDRPDFERAMQMLARQSSGGPLPGADAVWERAAALARYERTQRAMQPIRVAECVACLVCAAAGIGWAVALAPEWSPAWETLLGSALATVAAAAVVAVEAVTADE